MDIDLKGDILYELLATKSAQKKYSSFHDFMKRVSDEVGQDQAFYTYDLSDILWKAQLWNEQYPHVHPYYAVKACPDSAILRLFVLLGYGFDCSTEGEILAVLREGADPGRIIFAHPVKSRSALRFAREAGVDLLTFDCEEELVKIANFFPDARLILRVKSEGVHNNVYNLSEKYGCDVRDAEQLLTKGKELNLNIIGTSFHVGALCENPETFTNTIRDCRRIFVAGRKLGHDLSVLDIGAGFHGTHEKEAFFLRLSQEIRSCISENFPESNIKLIAEPGTYFVGSAGKLTTCVLGKKKINRKDDAADEVEVEYYLNDGFYGSFFKHCQLYDIVPVPLLPASEVKRRPVLRSKLWGQTCCSEDIILEKISMTELEDSEFIVWRNIGAYNQMMCSRFTLVPLPQERHVFVRNERLNLNGIEKAEEIISFIAEKTFLVDEDDLTPQIVNGHS